MSSNDYLGEICTAFSDSFLYRWKLYVLWFFWYIFQNFDELTVAMTVFYLLITLTSIGLLSEGNPYGSLFEFGRCVIFLLLSSSEDYFLQGVLRLYFLPSVVLWVIYLLNQLMMCYKAELKRDDFAVGTKMTTEYVAPTSKIYNGKTTFCLVENTAVLKTD